MEFYETMLQIRKCIKLQNAPYSSLKWLFELQHSKEIHKLKCNILAFIIFYQIFAIMLQTIETWETQLPEQKS